MRLSEFIHENASTIIAEWERSARAALPAGRLDRVALVDHVPRLLDHFVEVMRSRQAEPSSCASAAAAADVDEHVIERVEQGFSVSDVVRELTLLRACIVRLWRTAHPAVSIDDVELLTDVVDRAIERSVDRFLERRSALLEGFERIADAAFHNDDLDGFLDHLLRIFRSFAPSIDSATILLREGDQLVAFASVGLDEEVRERTSIRIGEGFAGTIAATRQPLFLENAWSDPLVQNKTIRERKTRALYGVPLTDGDRVIGVAHVGRSDASEIPTSEQRLFAALAQRATSAVIKHRLRRRARRTSAQLEAVVEAIPSVVLIGDRHRLTMANRAGMELLGLARREDVTADLATLLAPLEIRDRRTGRPLDLEENPYAVAVAQGDVTIRDVLLRHRATGVERVVRAHAGPIRQDGAIVGAVIVVSDLTELNAAMDTLRALVDNMPELSWMALPDGFIDFFNRRFYEYTGTTLQEVQGWEWQKLHDPAILPEVVRRWKESLAQGTPFEMEFPLRGADGVFRWFLTRSHPVRDPDGDIVRWIGTCTNIDEHRRSAEFRERFIGIVSHDLRTPMNAISMNAGLLAKAPALPPDLVKRAERIVVNVDRVSRMVSELLDFTRGRLGGGIPVDRVPTDLRTVVTRVVEDFEQMHPSRKIEVEFHGNTSGTWDSERLAQVVANLVGNAVEHGAREAPIRVAVRGEEETVVLCVHNAGPPIPPEALPQVFDPFRRAKKGSACDGSAGLGLGLFIAKEIARAHAGTIAVASDEGGTTFTVTLPR